LEKELANHKDIQHVTITPHRYNETHYWVNAACMNESRNIFLTDEARPSTYGSPDEARKLLIDLVQRNAPNAVLPADDQDIINMGWETICREFARPVFIEKTPHHAHYWTALNLLLDWMVVTQFEVRIIGLIRNPMEVMYSALKLFHTDPNHRQFAWLRANKNILRFKQKIRPEQFRMVCYENLVENPRVELGKLCHFIGVEYDGSMGSSVHSSSIGKWALDPTFVFQLDGSVSSFAREVGYSDDQITNAQKHNIDPIRNQFLKYSRNIKRMKSVVYDFYRRYKIKTGNN
jgi:hypothetical protein